jgi:tetrahydromethanopterin S-methyltransferase subunit E
VKAYVATTGVIFGLIVVAHIWRAIEEGLAMATHPGFIALTVAAAALAFWSWRVFKGLRHDGS